MNTPTITPPAGRKSVAVAVFAGLVLVAVAAYIFIGSPAYQPINGRKIIMAAQAYTRALEQKHAPIPHAVPLQSLVDQGYLKAADIGALQGVDARIFLTARNDEQDVLMKVHMPDGSDFVLLGDGTTHEMPR